MKQLKLPLGIGNPFGIWGWLLMSQLKKWILVCQLHVSHVTKLMISYISLPIIKYPSHIQAPASYIKKNFRKIHCIFSQVLRGYFFEWIWELLMNLGQYVPNFCSSVPTFFITHLIYLKVVVLEEKYFHCLYNPRFYVASFFWLTYP